MTDPSTSIFNTDFPFVSALIVFVGGLCFALAFTIWYHLRYRRKSARRARILKKRLQMMEVNIRQNKSELGKLFNFKQGLSHMISQDLKHALNIIIAISSEATSDKKMHTISQAGNLIYDLATNLLDVNRFESGRYVLKTQEVDLQALLEQASSRVSLIYQMKNLELDVRIKKKTTLVGDPNILLRVVVNLFTNAAKYTNSGRTIMVRALLDEEAKTCELSIADQGQGISPDRLPHIFDQYWIGDFKDRGLSSTGLGLAFCKMAIDAHGGKIWAESIQEVGSTFVLQLPILDESLSAPPMPEPLDDSPLVLEFERDRLMSFASQLNGLEVYQVGLLNQKIKRLDEIGIKSRWSDEFKEAVKKADEERFKSLVRQLTLTPLKI